MSTSVYEMKLQVLYVCLSVCLYDKSRTEKFYTRANTLPDNVIWKKVFPHISRTMICVTTYICTHQVTPWRRIFI